MPRLTTLARRCADRVDDLTAVQESIPAVAALYRDMRAYDEDDDLGGIGASRKTDWYRSRRKMLPDGAAEALERLCDSDNPTAEVVAILDEIHMALSMLSTALDEMYKMEMSGRHKSWDADNGWDVVMDLVTIK